MMESRGSIKSAIDSYEKRVKLVGALMKQAVKALETFGREQEEKILELRELLARTESLRKKDFDNLMEGIWAHQRRKEEETNHSLESFLERQEKLLIWVRKAITDGNIGPKEFKSLSQDMLTQQEKREKELTRTLRELHLDQKELELGLKKLLQKSEKVQIKDFKAMIKTIQLRQEGRQDEVGKMLNELQEIEEDVVAQWHKVMSAAETFSKQNKERGRQCPTQIFSEV